ncbi:MAG: site-specific DNA-methyltransferase [Acholeplasmataceae bacterium]|nr:site-specific DNA-methyltransferase [Acholeplasmataceae bacterium]
MDNKIYSAFESNNEITLYEGDCFNLVKSLPDESVDLIITSPPYAMGKAYERAEDDLDDFAIKHQQLFPELYRILKVGGSVCWQVGYHVKNGVVTPLDFVINQIISELNHSIYANKLILRNRIIWTFGHGLNAKERFSGRHETVLWYTKGSDYEFNLDEVRIPQKYPGKKYYKGEKKGEYSGNPLGKNPSDVWSIPNVKANHIEKTEHPCQFPVVVPQRLIKALTYPGDVVLDPFNGSGSTAVAALLEHRKYIGAEINKKYCDITKSRIQDVLDGVATYRIDKPVYEPKGNSSVTKKPNHFEW